MGEQHHLKPFPKSSDTSKTSHVAGTLLTCHLQSICTARQESQTLHMGWHKKSFSNEGVALTSMDAQPHQASNVNSAIKQSRHPKEDNADAQDATFLC